MTNATHSDDARPRGFPWVCAGLLLGMGLAAAAHATLESRVDLPLSGGSVLSVRVQTPKQAQAPLPAVMLFGGFERGEEVLDLVDGGRPKVLATFQYPLDLADDARGLDLWRALPAARRAIHDTLDGMGALHRHLQAMPEVDPERITVIGVSLGAPFAVIAAAEHDIPGLAVIHGFGRVDEVIAHQFGRRWARNRGDWVWAPAHLLGRLLNWYARIPNVEAHAARLRPDQHAWMLAAEDDRRLPADATRALREGFEQSRASFDFSSETGGHLRGGSDPRIPALLQQVEAWMVAQELH